MLEIETKIKIIVIGLVLTMLSAMPILAQEMICEYCQKEIGSGEYFNLDGKCFHAGHLFCTYCSKPIKGEFNYSGDEYYHLKCYDKYVALRCDLCGDKISGKYVTDYWGNKVHASHQDDGEPECAYCGRFIGEQLSKGGFRLSDDRIVCGICNETAVSDGDAAQFLMSEVGDVMESLGIKVDIANVALHLVSKPEMTQKSEGNGDKHLGLTTSKYEAETRKLVGGSQVFILFGLPKYSFIKVMAHELMHVWMAENRCVKGSKIISEGSCNYAAYLVLQKYDHPDARFELDAMERSRNRTYGSGFRAVRAFVADQGFDYWLEYIKSNIELPSKINIRAD